MGAAMHGQEHLDSMFHELFLSDLNDSSKFQECVPTAAGTPASAAAKAPPGVATESPAADPASAVGSMGSSAPLSPQPGNLVPSSTPTTAETLETINCYFQLDDKLDERWGESSPATPPPKPSPFRKYRWLDCHFYGFWLDETLAEAYDEACATGASRRVDGETRPQFAERSYWGEALASAQGIFA